MAVRWCQELLVDRWFDSGWIVCLGMDRFLEREVRPQSPCVVHSAFVAVSGKRNTDQKLPIDCRCCPIRPLPYCHKLHECGAVKGRFHSKVPKGAGGDVKDGEIHKASTFQLKDVSQSS